MTSKAYISPETVTTWTGSGGDKVLTLASLAADAVAMGAFQDLGASPRSQDYAFELKIGGFSTAPVIGADVDLYFSQSIATTNFDGNPTTDPAPSTVGTMTTDQLKNLMLVDVAIVPSTSTTDGMKITGVARLTSRYVSPVIHNNTVDALANTATGHSLILIPVPLEAQ